MQSKEIKFKYGILWINPKQEDFERFTEAIDINRDKAEQYNHLRLQVMMQTSQYAHFGILGATLYPHEDNTPFEFPQSCDDLYFEDDYPISLIRSLEASQSCHLKVDGKLTFDYRAYSTTDSSAFIFSVMAHCLVHYFVLPVDRLTPDLLKIIFDEKYKQLTISDR